MHFRNSTVDGGDEMTSWGGKREGAGRRPAAHDGTERKMRSTRASDEEWEMIKKFAQMAKDNPEKAEKVLAAMG